MKLHILDFKFAICDCGRSAREYASAVAQSFTLLYRRVPLCGRSKRSCVHLGPVPTKSRRYSRVKLCVTGSCRRSQIVNRKSEIP